MAHVPWKGFTLVEMLVAMGIFLVFSTVALGIYSSTLRAQRKTVALSRVQQEAQFLMEFIAKQVRTSTIDYPNYCSPPISNCTIPNNNNGNLTTLRLRDQKNQTVVIDFNAVAKNITISIAGGAARTISSNNIIINTTSFYIIPPASPTSVGGTAPTGQPRVSIVLDLQGIVSTQSGRIILQQTVPQQTIE